MTLDEFQAAARRTVNPTLDERDRLVDAVAGLSEESGELLGLVRKQIFQSRAVPRDNLLEELGDALWCLAITADALGFRLEEVAEANVSKLRRRHPTGFAAERASANSE